MMKKLVLAILIIIALSLSAFAQILPGNHDKCHGNASTGCTVTLNSTGASLLVAFDPLFTGLNAPIAITDSQSNTWVQVRYPWNNSSGVMWFCVNPSTSATHTFTLPNVENYGALFVRAYSGTATVNVLGSVLAQ